MIRRSTKRKIKRGAMLLFVAIAVILLAALPALPALAESAEGATPINFLSYIIDKALILIPVLLIIGQMLKSTPYFPDWGIPWALLVGGIVAAGFLVGWTIDGILQGVLVAGAAVFGNQLWKQTAKGIETNAE